MNRIAHALSDPNDTRASTTHIGYLPYRRHPAYDRLAGDWLSILRVDRLPNGHLFDPLFRITGLNLSVYLAERARDEIEVLKAEPIIADFTDGAESQLRHCSKEHVNRHRQAANRAVRAFIERRVQADERWRTAVSLEDSRSAQAALGHLFRLNGKEGRPPSPKEQLEAFIAQATSRDKNNIHKYFLPLTKGIGLATSRQRIGTWFAVDDRMLFALVMANADHTVELRDFVAKLYDRYGLVIGPDEARRAFDRLPVGVQSFEANLMALEARMTRLALTRRLSDDCAFVINPYK